MFHNPTVLHPIHRHALPGDRLSGGRRTAIRPLVGAGGFPVGGYLIPPAARGREVPCRSGNAAAISLMESIAAWGPCPLPRVGWIQTRSGARISSTAAGLRLFHNSSMYR